MSGNAASKADLQELLHGRIFDLLHTNDMSSVMLVDITGTGEPYPTILRVNPAFTVNTGYPAEEVLGRSTNFMLGPEAQAAVAKFRDAAREIKPARGELAIRTKSGEVRWVESVTTPFEVDGRIICLLVHRDISQRKRTEAALTQQTALLKQAETLGRIGHWTWDLKTDNVFWSDEIYRIHGLDHTDEARRGKPIDYYRGEDRELLRRSLGAARRTGEDFEFALRLVNPDQTVRFAETRGYCKRDENGEVSEVFGVFQDITEIRDMQAKLDAERDRLVDALESIEGGVLVLDGDDRLVMANRHYLDALPEISDIIKPGVPFKDILTAAIWALKDSMQIDDVDTFVAERMDRHRRSEGLDAYETVDGRWFKIEEHSMRDGGKLLIRLDITDHVDARQALLEAKEDAEFASRSKSDFLANMSHELRTPLNAIIGFGELLKLNLGSDMSAHNLQYVGDIVDSGEHLLDIINDILDISKIEDGSVLLDKSFVDVGELLESTVPLVRQSAAANGTRIIVETEPGLARLHCDSLRLKQVLLNLLSNGIKFTPNGSVTVALRVVDQTMCIDVTDTGIGMHRKDIDTALTPFGQIDMNHLTRQFQGTGLGLPLAKNLVELHGGGFTIASEPGKGTRVSLTFPLAI